MGAAEGTGMQLALQALEKLQRLLSQEKTVTARARKPCWGRAPPALAGHGTPGERAPCSLPSLATPWSLCGQSLRPELVMLGSPRPSKKVGAGLRNSFTVATLPILTYRIRRALFYSSLEAERCTTQKFPDVFKSSNF